MQFSKLVIFAFACLSCLTVFASGVEEASREAEAGNYKKAYNLLSSDYYNLQRELEEKQKLLDVYRQELDKLEKEKDDLLKLAGRGQTSADAERIWKEAWRIQRTAIHEKSGKGKEQMLLEAIGTFKEIIVNYPSSSRASDAQYRIGRLYYKFLDNKRKGYEELHKFVRDYPAADPGLIRAANKWIKQYEKKYRK